MSAPFLVLGGIRVPRHAGTPDITYSGAGGYTDTVMTDGAVVRSRHFKKELITITGAGWMATGLDALDWDANHLLLCSKVRRISTTGAAVTLLSDPRPDEPVFAQALIGRFWHDTPVSVEGRVVTITPMAGAEQYSVGWFPQYTVLCVPPSEESTAAGAAWQLVCREQ